jgi:hypothetical protein
MLTLRPLSRLAFAEFIIGRRFAPTRWLRHPLPLKSDISDFNKYGGPTRVDPSWMGEGSHARSANIPILNSI